jgi:outer membrane receptor protein involved in Fe transport
MLSSGRRRNGARSLLLALFLVPLYAFAQALYQFDLPAQSLSDTLRAIGSKSGLNVAFDPSTVRGKTAPAVSGSYTAADAIKHALEGTGLAVREVKEGSVLIVDPTPPADTADSEDRLQEVLVTAQKSLQLAQDVPIALTVLNAQSLISRNEVSLDDYYTRVPGLTLFDDGNGFKLLAIRGITTGMNNTPTVGVYVDDTPVGSSTALARGDVLVPDLDPGDLSQIEVLKGPQGTLYGSSNMGGLLKYETVQPNLTSFSGNAEADGAYVDHGSSGYGVRANVNLPLISDVFALRISGSTREDPGYVDNVATGQTNVNSIHVTTGRIAALWAPLDGLTVKASAIVQDRRADGSGREDYDFTTHEPIFGDLTHDQIPGTGTNKSLLHLYNITVDYDFDKFSVLSSTSYAHVDYQSFSDISPEFGPLLEDILGIPGLGGTIYQHYGTEKFTQEMRLASRGDNRVDWLAGAFFTHETSVFVQDLNTASITDGSVISSLSPLSAGTGDSEYKEGALFGDVTYHVNSQIDVQGGVRYSKNWQSSLNLSQGLLGPPGVTVGQGDSSEGVTTFLFTPSFKFDPDNMVYGRIASGYRAGGPNYTLAGNEYPFGSDKSTSYEVGYKGDLLDKRLTIGTDFFYITWKNIQLLGSDDEDQSFFSNAGSAISKGWEFSAEYRLLRGLTFGLSAAYTDAYLTSTAPAGIYALPGFRLPYSARWSGRASVDYEFPIVAQWNGDVGADYSYIGQRESDFTADNTTPRVSLPSYRVINLHAGVTVNRYSVNLYVKNLADERGIISATPLTLSKSPDYEGISIIQPRTIGLSAAVKF